MADTSVKLLGKTLKNPIIGASGAVGFGVEYSKYVDWNKIGGIATKAITENPRPGNPGIRIYETPAGIMNSIGLENSGVDVAVSEQLKFLYDYDTRIFANVSGSTIEEYKNVILKLNDTNIDYIELNISCPNVKEGGMAFGIKCESAEKIVRETKAVLKKPMIVKLSPNAENITEMAKACESAGADGLSLVNTFNALAIDIVNRKPVFENITAGLSGPAIKPIALRMVYEVCKAVKIPVIGMGGITCVEDVIEFIMVGATAVQVGTGNFYEPCMMENLAVELEEYMDRENIKNLDEIRGII